MPEYDYIYCYSESNVLKNKLNVTDAQKLFNIEKGLTFVRLKQLEKEPIKGEFDFDHLKAIHRHIFQDLYDWAGESRTVEIGKGNFFCLVKRIDEYAYSIFNKYYPQCCAAKDNREEFIKVFARNYGDLNALHPFREGNGRAQREFARLICLECGYVFDLSCTTHSKMLEASILSFDLADNSLLEEIFKEAVVPISEYTSKKEDELSILTSDDMTIDAFDNPYDYYGKETIIDYEVIEKAYKSKINDMNREYDISKQ